MAKLEQILKNCRFCLCHQANLLPLNNIINSSLTTKDVERFTGIKIRPIETTSFRICMKCTKLLRNSADFFYVCVNNDRFFYQLRAKALGTPQRPPIAVVDHTDGSDADPLAVKCVMLGDSSKLDNFDVEAPAVTCNSDKLTERKEEQNATEDVFAYSANCIEPGECLYTDEEWDDDVFKPTLADYLSDDSLTNAPLPQNSGTASSRAPLPVRSTYVRRRPLCDICGKVVTSLMIHLPTHTKEANYACPHCPTRMTHSANLMRHVQSVHLKKVVITCEICGKGFTHKNNYISHQSAKHNIGVKHECRVCHRSFNHASSLRSHFKRAHGSQKFTCETCGQLFKMPCALKIHQRVHSTDKPYGCRHCSKSFKCSESRKKHELVHAGVVFNCKLCSKSYRYKSLLNKHMRNMHPTEDSDKKLQASTAFRNLCMNNDSLFKELCVVLATSATSAADEPLNVSDHSDSEEEITHADNDVYDTFEQFEYQSSIETSPGTCKSAAKTLSDNAFSTCQQSDDDERAVLQTSRSFIIENNDSEPTYSANYIALGEPFSDDDASNRRKNKKRFRFPKNVRPHRKSLGREVAGIRSTKVRAKKKVLCDICGLLVGYLRQHLFRHGIVMNMFQCSYCPVKMTQKSNLQAHISTVHLKTIGKTCGICGKGFVHHKTFRYHMLRLLVNKPRFFYHAMAIAIEQIRSICRFCLCQEEKSLTPITEAIPPSLTTEDLERCTGIKLSPAGCISYAICFECTEKFKVSIAFRILCISNDALFKELASTADKPSPETVSSKSTKTEVQATKAVSPPSVSPPTSKRNGLRSSKTVPTALQAQKVSNENEGADILGYNEFVEKGISESDMFEISQKFIANDVLTALTANTASVDGSNGEEFMHSANHIELGEPFSDDDAYLPTPTKRRRNPAGKREERQLSRKKMAAERSTTYKDGKRIYKKALCDICGKFVNYLRDHAMLHGDHVLMYECSHCPVKMNNKKNLQSHIKTVHLKTVGKTCGICGKGFVHPKTYRYHMIASNEEENGIGLGYIKHEDSHSASDVFEVNQELNPTHGPTEDSTDDENFMYSANHIEPGEIVSDGEPYDNFVEYLTITPMTSFRRTRVQNSTKPRKKYKQGKRIRKKTLCDICGKSVFYLPNHLVQHGKAVSVHQCPYCPAKMYQKNNLQSHINTVHLKTIGKTCGICGKGFVHHKTYRYHMLSHHGEGNTFECKLCAKKFSHAGSLRDHINRLHNITKEEEILMPIAKILNAYLTVEDVVRFTGIQINTSDQASYVVCPACKDKLRKSTAFLQSCISNDSLFQELREVLQASTEPLYDEPVEYLDNWDDADDTFDIGGCDDFLPTDSCFSDAAASGTMEISYEENYLVPNRELASSPCPSQLDLTNDDAFDYSANFIEPGDHNPDDDDLRLLPITKPPFTYPFQKRPYTKRKTVGEVKAEMLQAQLRGADEEKRPLSESDDVSQSSPQEETKNKRKRKLHLCAMCGIFVLHVPSHILIHLEEQTFACPHCPVRMKQSGNMQAHISTVHLKAIGKTCKICGKGFVHHKTYRYHMRTHQEVGETFECKVCSKQFTRSTGLDDHLKNQEEEMLMPLATILSAYITVEDVMRFTGIQINTPDKAAYVVCCGCKDKLKKSAVFLQSCISNDSLFQELREVLQASTEPLYDEPVEYLDESYLEDAAEPTSAFDDYEDFTPADDTFTEPTVDVKQETYEEYVVQEADTPASSRIVEQELPNAHAFDYSANYIKPGELSSDDNDDDGDIDTSYDPARPRFVYSSMYRTFTTRKSVAQMKAEKLQAQLHAEMVQAEILAQASTSAHNESGNTSQTSEPEERPCRIKRKQHLCEMCGIYVRHVASHILIHLEDNTFACPHCPVRMKQNGNLRQHIKTVHKKTIGKTCNICGKGFVHHKTYRYHMLSHNEVGKTFECKDKELLVPASETLCPSLTLEDVERCTGVQIIENGKVACLMCLTCENKLKKFTVFRSICLGNDGYYRDISARAASVPDEIDRNASDSDGDPLESCSGKQERDAQDDTRALQIQDERCQDSGRVCNAIDETVGKKEQDGNYYVSANVTDETISDHDDHRPELVKFSPKITECKQPCHTKSSTERSAKRRCKVVYSAPKTPSEGGNLPKCPKQLCATCGKFVANMSFHVQTHAENVKLDCPHCPVKIRHKKSLQRHIEAVHQKKIVTFCERTYHGTGPEFQCAVCSKKFNHPSSLASHMTVVHSNVRRFECTTCGKCFKTKVRLKVHYKVHSTDQPFACRQCPKRFKSRFARQTHEVTHSGVLFKCTLCDKSYRYKSLLSMHFRKMHPEEGEEAVETGADLVECDVEILSPLAETIDSALSSEDIERFTGIQIHTDKLHAYAICATCTSKLRKSAVFRYSCIQNDAILRDLCTELVPHHGSESDSSDLNSRYLKTTLFEIEVINEDEGSSCVQDDFEDQVDDCPASDGNVSDANDATSNMITKPSTKTPSNKSRAGRNVKIQRTKARTKKERQPGIPGRGQQLCVMCGKMVKNLSRHILSHTQDTKHQCPHCPVEMVDQSNLVRHIEAVHLKKVVKSCELCGKGFTHNNTYKSHMRSQHEIGETYKCSFCMREFNHPGGLRDHVKRVHSNEYNFTCSTCGKLFKLKQELRVHERVHSTDQPYACSQCPKRFKSRFAQKTHEVTHSGVVFACSLCNKAYRYKSLLSRHLKKMHPDEAEQLEQKSAILRDESLLQPLMEIIHSPLSINNVNYFTGIQINTEEIIESSICVDCTDRITTSAAFLEMCLNNDGLFQELRKLLIVSATDCSTEDATEPMQESDSTQDTIDLEEKKFVVESIEPCYNEPVLDENDEQDVKLFSANYIEPGEALTDDDDDDDDDDYHDEHSNTKSNIEQSKPRHSTKTKQPHPEAQHEAKRKGVIEPSFPLTAGATDSSGQRPKYTKRKKVLCATCGKSVINMTRHMQNHTQEIMHSCPYCPIKMTQKTNIVQHIQTVHLRTIGKTCDICERGFVHHKTYRNHLASILGIAKGRLERMIIVQIEEDLLVPITKAINDSLTIADIERFSCIEVKTNERFTYAICCECATKLKKSSDFRHACIANDTVFHQLLEETIEQSQNASLSLEENGHCLNTEYDKEFAYVDNASIHASPKSSENVNEDDFCYSANYIEPGESMLSDSEGCTPIPPSEAAPSQIVAKALKLLKRIRATKQAEREACNPGVPTKRIIYMRQKQLCELCGKLIRSVASHSATHAQEPAHACPHCPMRMTLAVNLKRHVQSVHMKKAIKKCLLCDKGFTNSQSYRSHMLSQHDIGEKCKCTVCLREFNSRSHLSDHLRRFHGSQRHECLTCGQQFRLRRSLRIHQRVHSTDQPYECNQCPKRFKSKHARNMHQLTHTGVRFTCELCGKSYRYKSLLNMHLRKTHMDETAAEFCLCRDANLLCSISETIDSLLSVEDVEWFSGIQITADELALYTICVDCTDSLRKAAEFRNTSLSNDARFRQLSVEFHDTAFEAESEDDEEDLHFTKIEQVSIEFVYDSQASMKQDVLEDELIVDSCWQDEPDDSSGQADDAMEHQFSCTKHTTPTEQGTDGIDSISEATAESGERQKHTPEVRNEPESNSSKPAKQLCTICGKLVAHLSWHIALHAKKDSYFTCPHCPTKMNDPANLGRHVHAVHLKTIVKTCELCGKGFTHNNSYVSHMRSHHDIGESHKCRECPKQFKYSSGLRDHIRRSHSNDNHFACETCDKIFKTRQTLRAHENVHTTNKPFDCNQCPKRFRSRNARNSHQLTHSGVTFDCALCDKSYRYKVQLQAHVKKMHFYKDAS
uniref:Uncharacterized protein n=1 Tax=Anopheles dirus TaxID=7168 RepID=A0A182NPL1_9DIPT